MLNIKLSEKGNDSGEKIVAKDRTMTRLALCGGLKHARFKDQAFEIKR
jgi:hypothetical protein